MFDLFEKKRELREKIEEFQRQLNILEKAQSLLNGNNDKDLGLDDAIPVVAASVQVPIRLQQRRSGARKEVVLRLLDRPMSITQIARDLQWDGPATINIVKPLVRGGAARIADDSGSSPVIELTGKGKRVAKWFLNNPEAKNYKGNVSQV